MELFAAFSSEQTVRQTGWVLVHFLWQGSAMGALMWMILKLLSKASSNARYLAACAGLSLMAAAPIVTFVTSNEPAPTVVNPSPTFQPAPAAAEPPEPVRSLLLNADTPETPRKSITTVVTEKLDAALPWCVMGWVAGVAGLSLWYLGGWCQLQKLRLNGIKTVSRSIEKETSELAHRLGIKKAVGIAESVLVQVPTLVGWLKPAILLPVSALTGLDETQLRAMIAHELAHIKRCDYVVNIAQTVVEILGFYHPAVWWVSKQIRIERENCCDDVAVELMQDRKEYAKALYSMEEIRTRQLALALGARGGSLTDRIGRLVGKADKSSPISGWIPSVIVLALISAIVVPTVFAFNNSNSDNIPDMAARQLPIQEWVENFFKHNYRDISSRQTLEWGEPNQDSSGNYSIRYKYEAVILGKDKIISNELFTFSETGKFISVKKLNTEQPVEDVDLHVYQVNRKVSDFPETEDFSTPQNAYAAINRAMAEGTRAGWQRVSTRANAERIAQFQKEDQKVDAEWAKVVLNARILEVRIKDDQAVVIAEFPQDFSGKEIKDPIDARYLKFEDGKWLNTGEDRFGTSEQATQKFGRIIATENKTEIAYKNALDEPEKFKTMAQELFDKLRAADYNKVLSYYDEETGKWRQDGWKKLDLDYCVHTDWPSFALWVCRTFKDNPIVSVELGEPFISKKENDGFKAPAVPYKLTLKDGGILQGELYFAYRASGDNWQPAEGIDWHLQESPIIYKEASKPLSNLAVVTLEFEPVAQGKNTLYTTVKNRSNREQLFAIHIYSRSPDYGPAGIGWGTVFFETLKAGEMKRLRFVYKIQGPVTEKTFVRVKFYNPDSETDYDYEKPFATHLYESKNLKKKELSQKSTPVSEKQFNELSESLKSIQDLIVNKEYEKAWDLFTEDYRKAEYQGRGIEAFRKQMEPTHPLHSGFLWEKADFLKLQPVRAYETNGNVQLEAVCGDTTWAIGFAKEGNTWKIHWIGGYTPAVIGPPASKRTGTAQAPSRNDKLLLGPNGTGYFDRNAAIQIGSVVIKIAQRIEAANIGTDTVEIKSDNTENKLLLGPNGTGYFDHNAAIQIGDALIRVGERIEVTNTGSGTIEILSFETQPKVIGGGFGGGMRSGMGRGMGAMGGGMGGFGGGITPTGTGISPVTAESSAQEKGMIRGTVVDSKGNAAPGALVLPMPHGGDPVITDSAGKFEIAGPSQDPSVDRRIDFLLVRNPETNEAAIAHLDSLASPARIQLTAAITLSGFVKDSAGRPIGGATVFPSILNGWEAALGNTQFNLTNIDGYFEIPALPQELEYRLHVKAHGFGTHEERLGQFSNSVKVEVDTIVLQEKEQIGIEARFILAGDSLMETIGLKAEKSSGKVVEGFANSDELKAAMETQPLTERSLPLESFQVLDDLQVSSLLKATQQQKTSKMLTAPKALVLNNEAALMRVATTHTYTDISDEKRDIDSGVQLQILPSIQDGRNVLLKVNAQFTDISDYRTQENNGKKFEIPWVQITSIPFQANIASGGTVFVAGQEISVKNEQTGVLERQRLYVLLKPTLIMPEKS